MFFYEFPSLFTLRNNLHFETVFYSFSRNFLFIFFCKVRFNQINFIYSADEEVADLSLQDRIRSLNWVTSGFLETNLDFSQQSVWVFFFFVFDQWQMWFSKGNSTNKQKRNRQFSTRFIETWIYHIRLEFKMPEPEPEQEPEITTSDKYSSVKEKYEKWEAR